MMERPLFPGLAERAIALIPFRDVEAPSDSGYLLGFVGRRSELGVEAFDKSASLSGLALLDQGRSGATNSVPRRAVPRFTGTEAVCPKRSRSSSPRSAEARSASLPCLASRMKQSRL